MIAMPPVWRATELVVFNKEIRGLGSLDFAMRKTYS
jgi:hypothetical protein